jgi:predicted dehydrogenase
MERVRLGIIGVGGMGATHAREVLGDKINRCVLTAVADIDPERTAAFKDAEGLQSFSDSKALIRSGCVDAVLIATPHYAHTTVGMDALGQGLHVLTEKPISVHKADCERLIGAHRKRKQVFAAMFNQRTDPHYIKLKQLIDQGELGELLRVNWIITDWFRSEAYYANGGWRATWAGEGGGVLLNQSPHQLDLLQWLCGMPKRVRAFCHFGKKHHVEVEDEVTAYLEYANGATGVFLTSTCEAPGTNRLEICGEKGKVVVENDVIHFTRNEIEVTQFIKTSELAFATPDRWEVTIPVEGHGGQHNAIMQNFVDAILDNTPLISPAKEGINSVELANAMLLSAIQGKTVELPMNAATYARVLKKLIRDSKFVKVVKRKKDEDMNTSF